MRADPRTYGLRPRLWSSLEITLRVDLLLRTVSNSNFTLTAQILARLLANVLSSISGQTNEFIIYAMRQRARGDDLRVCYRKKQMDVSF